MTAPIASGWSESPGGPCTHWKAPPCHGARRKRSFSHLISEPRCNFVGPRTRCQVTRFVKLRDQANRACVQRPKHSQRASHRCERHDGKEWRRQDGLQRKLLLRHGRPSARRCAGRSQHRTPSRRPGSPGASATRVVGKQCREHQGEDQSRSAGPRRTRQPELPMLRSHDPGQSSGRGWVSIGSAASPRASRLPPPLPMLRRANPLPHYRRARQPR